MSSYIVGDACIVFLLAFLFIIEHLETGEQVETLLASRIVPKRQTFRYQAVLAALGHAQREHLKGFRS